MVGAQGLERWSLLTVCPCIWAELQVKWRQNGIDRLGMIDNFFSLCWKTKTSLSIRPKPDRGSPHEIQTGRAMQLIAVAATPGGETTILVCGLRCQPLVAGVSCTRMRHDDN